MHIRIISVSFLKIAACSSGVVWLFISWIKDKPTTVALLNGVIAGLAGITPASGILSKGSGGEICLR